MDASTVILPSARSIRQRLLRENDGFTRRYLLMSDFLSKVLLFPGYKYIDDDMRVVLLLRAAAFENFAKLKIERNFFAFTSNAPYLLSFYEELSSETVPIERLLDADVYAQYQEHIEILRHLLERYETLTIQRGFIDKIFFPKYYTLNVAFIEGLGDIEVVVGGMLTNFELRLLEEATQYARVVLCVEITPFYSKMQEKFESLGITVQAGYRYRIDLGKREILHREALASVDSIEAYALSSRILQAGLVKQKIYEFVQEGIDPEKIAVILPEESFAKYLALFDNERNFNFAMGKPFSESVVYRKLQATLDFLDEVCIENEAKIRRLGDELLEVYRGVYAKRTGLLDLENLLERLKEFAEGTQEREILQEEIFRFLKLESELADLPFRSTIHLFLKRLKQRSIDDVGGGKITVMGLLESRLMQYDGVIVVDFNESYVPKKLQKDMFLNSSIRSYANLPTRLQREELQKHYYYGIFLHAKKSVLCYTSNKDAIESKFLRELPNVLKKTIDEAALSRILLPISQQSEKMLSDATFSYDFTKGKLSSTKLQTWLTCRRKFYNRYVLGIEPFEIPSDTPEEWEMGKTLHLALQRVYSQNDRFEDPRTLHALLIDTLRSLRGKSELEKFQTHLYAALLEPFSEAEVRRFRQGYRVAYTEIALETQVEGITLYGVIDRIDEKDARLEVIDYKTGSIPTYTQKTLTNATNFQLEFYYLLAQTLGKVGGVYFYDLKNASLVQEPFLEQKIELLREHLRSLAQERTFVASMCEEKRRCKFCPYNVMCGRA